MKYIIGAIFILLATFTYAQKNPNYDEAKVPQYTLPDVLTCEDGSKVTTVKEWKKKRRPEILEWFSANVYGRTPQEKIKVRYETLSENPNDMGGKATSKQVKFIFSNGKKAIEAIMLLYIPNQVKGKVPVFVGYNFKGNHSTTLDTTVLYSVNFPLVKAPDHRDWKRGVQMSRWSYDLIIDRGYAIATMFYQDIFPDVPGLKEHSIVSLFSDYDPDSTAPDEWQAIGAWAWGSSRIVDYLEKKEKRLNINQIAIMGHSRQGKAALWAGALDSRFKVVISNDSGCGGAALSMREYGERLEHVTSIKPAWFCPAYNDYILKESTLPYDQHELLALIAPRHLYVASAVEDRWADPKGEFLATYYAGPVFELYGKKGLGTDVMPNLNEPIMQDVGYHIRTGIHDVTEYDWKCFLDFADLHFRN